MNGNILETSTEKLLKEFGSGGHKPGAGSAAALQGMLSAQLILTVIELTTDEKRKDDYQSIYPQVNEMSAKIKNRIYPRLEALFQQDSEQFHAAIELRIARDKERRFKAKKRLAQQAKDALKVAVDIPLEISKLCIELADYATFIFNNGFRTARGDSGVALNCLTAVVPGCLSIIDLNLLSIEDQEWIENIRVATIEIKRDYDRLLLIAKNDLLTLEKEVESNQALHTEINILRKDTLSKFKLTNADIEDVAGKIQNLLWRYRDTVLRKEKPATPIEVLRPKTAFEKLLNYTVLYRNTLGDYNLYGELVEVAGIIDNDNKAVGISKKFPSHVQNFTLAHELGHALLHKQSVLHRDKALDGTSGIVRTPIEMQADKFASYFLMPKKQVVKVFQEQFLMERFILNEDNIFALTGGSVSSFKAQYRNLRELSRFVASAEFLYGSPFKSIAEIFGVSTEAMAIRLEEIGLVDIN